MKLFYLHPMRLRFLFLLFSLFAPPALAAPTAPLVQAELVSEAHAILPGQDFTVGLALTMPLGWHSYADPPGDAGIATSIAWQLPEGFTASPIAWPPSQTLQEETLTVYGYTGHIVLPVKITPPARLPDEKYTLKAQASWLVCHDICIPESAEVALTLPRAAAPAGNDSAVPLGSGGLLTALLLALLGGLILNLMPCVFPVLSLKCLAVARARHFTRAEARAEGVAYTLGVLACFGVIAGVLLALKAGGEAIGWGYQMQSPAFVTALALTLFIIGLNLSGLFTLPVLLGGAGEALTREPTLKGSFATGALATLVATPCTAPFMATAVGYALTQSAFSSLLIFEALGLGLALPFLLVSLFPALFDFLPKPGAWMETFRQLLAFPMYLSVVWLVWVLTQQAGAHAVGVIMAAGVMIAFFCWTQRRFLAPLLVALIVLSAVMLVHRLPYQQASPTLLLHGGEAYSPARLEQLQASHTPVFIDATAAWCITCQVNYRTTLGTQAVRTAFQHKGVVFMVADWTRADPAITTLLERFGHKGVPMYVYFPTERKPRLLPQLLTPAIVLGAIEE